MFVQTDEERASTIQPESDDFAETGGTTQLSQPNLLLARGRPVFDLEHLNDDRHLGAIDLAAIFQAVASNGLESLPPERKLLPRIRVAIDDGDDFEGDARHAGEDNVARLRNRARLEGHSGLKAFLGDEMLREILRACQLEKATIGGQASRTWDRCRHP